MQSVALAVPIQPGKSQEFKEFVAELNDLDQSLPPMPEQMLDLRIG